mgnify:CR=1 FL=1
MRLALDVWEMNPRSSPVTRQMHENALEAKWLINKESEVWMKLTAMILTNVCSRLVVTLTFGTLHFSSTSPIWKARFRHPFIFQFRFWHHIFVHQFRFQHPNYLLKFSSQTHTVLTVHATVQYSNTPSFANREIPTSQITVSNTTPELKIPNSERKVSNITKLCLHREGGAKKRNIFTLMLFVFHYRSFTLVNVAHCRSL